MLSVRHKMASPADFSGGWFGRLCLIVLIALAVPSKAEARRTLIDFNSAEVTGDAENGSTINLPFAVNLGSGLQSTLTVGLPTTTSTELGFPTRPISLSFGPTNILYASFIAGGTNQFEETAVRTASADATSTATTPLATASSFNFGIANPLTFVPYCGPPEAPICYNYTPFTGSALFEFTDLSASGTAGDFGLLLFCGERCVNIGFSLAGLDFSQDLFDPTAPPSQLSSFSLAEQGNTFNFTFRSASAVPEPTSWLMMLCGFAMIGSAVRRRGRNPRSAQPA